MPLRSIVVALAAAGCLAGGCAPSEPVTAVDPEPSSTESADEGSAESAPTQDEPAGEEPAVDELAADEPAADDAPTTEGAAAVAGDNDIGETLAEQLDWMCRVLTTHFEDRSLPLMQRMMAADDALEAGGDGSLVDAFVESIPPGPMDTTWDRLVAHAATQGVEGFECPAARDAFAMIAAGEDDWDPEGTLAGDVGIMCAVAEEVLGDESIQPEFLSREWADRVDRELTSAEGRALFERMANLSPEDRVSAFASSAVEAGLTGFHCEAWGVLQSATP